MLVSNWQGKSLAIDFTLITPDRPSAHDASGAAVMDSAARCKERKSADLCTAAGWDFLPFVGDTYGALRTDARNFVSSFISRYAARFEPLTVAAGSARNLEYRQRRDSCAFRDAVESPRDD